MVEAQTNRIKVADSNVKNFKAMLRFLYSGALRGPFDVEEVLILASKYDLPGLIKVCTAKMEVDLSAHRGSCSVFRLVKEKAEMAAKFGIPGVQEALERMLCSWCLSDAQTQMRCTSHYYPLHFEDRPLNARQQSEHDEILDFLATALGFAHVQGFPTLKRTCLGLLEQHSCDLDTEASSSMLEQLPELAIEMMRRFHRKVAAENKMMRSEQEEHDRENMDGDLFGY